MAAPAPMSLLLRINALQAWRRLKSVRSQSRLLTGFIVAFMTGYWVFSFWLFFKGLKFVSSWLVIGTVLTERLLYLLFAFLFVLLLLSNLVISYSNLFRNREAGFLLSLPVRAQTIFRWKFFESTLLASWAFLFLIAPLLAAYGLTRDVPWHFYPATLMLIGLFILLPGVAGSWAAVTLARFLDRRAFQIAALAVVLLLALAAGWLWKANPVDDELLQMRVLSALDQLLQKTRFAQFPLLPSYWLSTGVLQWAEGVLTLAAFFILVLLSHVLFFGFLAFTRLGNFYYDAVSQVQSRASVWGQWEWFRASARRKKVFSYPRGPLERVAGLLPGLGRDTAALLVKDARMFWRDTTQWGQSVLLLGLLGVYLINLRQFTGQLTDPYWIHMVAHMNLGACSLSLAMLTTRFAYPQFSLEGQRLWIVGMAPMGLKRVVKAKFWLATCASMALTLGLVLLSNSLLKLDPAQMAFFAAVIVVMSFTLNGLAGGLGVLYPNFRETNPSKIVSGFGGTFCFVLSFLYILGSILILAYASATTRRYVAGEFQAVLGISAFILFSFALGWVPLKLGLRHLRRFEF